MHDIAEMLVICGDEKLWNKNTVLLKWQHTTENQLCCHTKLVLELAVRKSKDWKRSQMKQKWDASVS